jgi:selT/selW/selH-like putative selenoprotein
MIIGGDKFLRYTMIVRNNRPLPSWYFAVQENAAPIAIFLFLLAPNIVQNMGNTKGAFEIYLNDTIVFSKLSTGAFPTGDDLTQPLIQAGLKMLKKK